MQIVTIDFETYYDKEYSLKKLTTEEYINDDRFEAIMVGIIWPDGTKEIITGTHAEIKFRLDGYEDWKNSALLAHNCRFDAAILAWKFGIKPMAYLDTLSMARAMFGGRGNSLEALAKKYGMQEKGTFIVNALGMHREDFSKTDFKHYSDYCIHDAELCLELFSLFKDGWYDPQTLDKRDLFPQKELKIIDRIIRMFVEPTLLLDTAALQSHLKETIERKEALLASADVSREAIMSNNNLAELLRKHGVVPPTKISPTTGKRTLAFAKIDEAFKALLEHPNEAVQTLIATRLGVKSTLEETRTARLLEISKRTKYLPIPLRYSAARTHRLGGDDKINLQNLPSRGEEKNKIKNCIVAPPGYVILDGDSSNIEARMLAWLAGQDDLVTDFANGVDVYCKMASRIYGKEITKDNPLERFVGKTVVLGAGYQTGGFKLQATLQSATPPMSLDIDECTRIIDTYRDTYYKIPKLWQAAELAIQCMYNNETMWLGREGVVLVDGKRGIKLPNGLYISYPSLHRGVDKKRGREGWMYKDINGLVNIYGGKLIENVVQALACIVVKEQLLKVSYKYRVPLTVHDSVVALAKVSEWEAAYEYVEQCMRWKPEWAEGCPINCEIKLGYTYGNSGLRHAFNEDRKAA